MSRHLLLLKPHCDIWDGSGEPNDGFGEEDDNHEYLFGGDDSDPEAPDASLNNEKSESVSDGGDDDLGLLFGRDRDSDSTLGAPSSNDPSIDTLSSASGSQALGSGTRPSQDDVCAAVPPSKGKRRCTSDNNDDDERPQQRRRTSTGAATSYVSSSPGSSTSTSTPSATSRSTDIPSTPAPLAAGNLASVGLQAPLISSASSGSNESVVTTADVSTAGNRPDKGSQGLSPVIPTRISGGVQGSYLEPSTTVESVHNWTYTNQAPYANPPAYRVVGGGFNLGYNAGCDSPSRMYYSHHGQSQDGPVTSQTQSQTLPPVVPHATTLSNKPPINEAHSTIGSTTTSCPAKKPARSRKSKKATTGGAQGSPSAPPYGGYPVPPMQHDPAVTGGGFQNTYPLCLSAQTTQPYLAKIRYTGPGASIVQTEKRQRKVRGEGKKSRRKKKDQEESTNDNAQASTSGSSSAATASGAPIQGPSLAPAVLATANFTTSMIDPFLIERLPKSRPTVITYQICPWCSQWGKSWPGIEDHMKKQCGGEVLAGINPRELSEDLGVAWCIVNGVQLASQPPRWYSTRDDDRDAGSATSAP